MKLRTQVCSMLLTRHGGLPVDAVEPLIGTDLDRLLEQFEREEARLREVSSHLERELFEAVPRTTAKEVRRRLLNHKRDVHNLRFADIESSRTELVDLGVPARVLDDWTRACSELRSSEAALVHEIATTDEAARRAATDALTRTGVLRSLALASPSFVDELLEAKAGTPMHKAASLARFDRTSTAYLTRAALKTSPFGELGPVGEARLGSATTGTLDDSSRMSFVLANRALATDLLRVVSRRAGAASRFLFEVNPGLFHVKGELLATLPLRIDDFMWTQDVITEAGILAPFLARLRPGETLDFAEILNRLAEMGGFDAFVRLLDLGVISPVGPWQRWSDDPIAVLANHLRDADDLAAHVVGNLARVHDDAASTTLERRLEGIRNIRLAGQTAYERLGATVPGWLTSTDVLHEDAVLGATSIRLGPRIGNDLRELGDYLAGRVFATALYDELVDFFVAEYGVGGCCDEPLAFATAFVRAPEGAAILQSAMRRDTESMAMHRHPPRRSRPPLPPGVVVFFQVVAETPSDIDAGDYTVVVNQLTPGLGGMIARWCPSLDETGVPASQELRTWLQRAAGEREPVTIPLSADWNSLHNRGGGLLRSFRWPLETASGTAAELSLAELSLHHVPESNSIDFRLKDGRSVTPVYLGTVPMHMVYGPARILYTLSDPWIVPDPAGSVAEMFGARERPRAVVRQARISEGRTVYRRARWLVPPRTFPVQERSENDLRFARRVRAFWAEHDLPDEVFVSLDNGGLESEAKYRKPVWVHRNSLHSLRAVGPLVTDAHLGVRLVEALPARGQHWVAGAAGRVATEFLALVRWEVDR
jgi:hypothetical protein